MRLHLTPVSRCGTTSFVLRHVAIIASLLVGVFQAPPAGATPTLYTLAGATAYFGATFGTATITGTFTADPTVIGVVSSAAPTTLTVTGLSSSVFNQTYATRATYANLPVSPNPETIVSVFAGLPQLALEFTPPLAASGTFTLFRADLSDPMEALTSITATGDATPPIEVTSPGTGVAAPTTVPEPQTLWLLGAAIALFSLLRRCVTL
jgi:hypothetical protein